MTTTLLLTLAASFVIGWFHLEIAPRVRRWPHACAYGCWVDVAFVALVVVVSYLVGGETFGMWELAALCLGALVANGLGMIARMQGNNEKTRRFILEREEFHIEGGKGREPLMIIFDSPGDSVLEEMYADGFTEHMSTEEIDLAKEQALLDDVLSQDIPSRILRKFRNSLMDTYTIGTVPASADWDVALLQEAARGMARKYGVDATRVPACIFFDEAGEKIVIEGNRFFGRDYMLDHKKFEQLIVQVAKRCGFND